MSQQTYVPEYVLVGVSTRDKSFISQVKNERAELAGLTVQVKITVLNSITGFAYWILTDHKGRVFASGYTGTEFIEVDGWGKFALVRNNDEYAVARDTARGIEIQAMRTPEIRKQESRALVPSR